MKRKLWINWEDRYFFYDEISEDIIIDTMIDICFEEEPGFEKYEIFSGDCGAELKIFLGIERFNEIKEKAIEKITSRLDYYEF